MEAYFFLSKCSIERIIDEGTSYLVCSVRKNSVQTGDVLAASNA